MEEDEYDYQTEQQPFYYQSEYYSNDFHYTTPVQQDTQPLLSSNHSSFISTLKPVTNKGQLSTRIVQVVHTIFSIALCVLLIVVLLLGSIFVGGIVLITQFGISFIPICTIVFYPLVLVSLFSCITLVIVLIVQCIACCTILQTSTPNTVQTLQQNLKQSIPHIMAKGHITQHLYRAEQMLYMEELHFQLQPCEHVDHTNGIDRLLEYPSTMFSNIRIVHKMQLDEYSEKWIKDQVEELKQRCNITTMSHRVELLKRFAYGENQFAKENSIKIIEQQYYRNTMLEALLQCLCCVGLIMVANWIKSKHTTFLELEIIVPVKVIGVEKQVKLNLMGTNTTTTSNNNTILATSEMSLEQYIKNCCTRLVTEQQMNLEMAAELERVTLFALRTAYITSVPMLLSASLEQYERIQLPVPIDYILRSELPNLNKKQ